MATMKVLLFASLAQVLLLGCSGPDTEAMPGPTRGTDALRVRRGDFRQVVQLNGEIEASQGVGIAVPRVPNWQTSIKTLIDDGTSVKPGDVLTELDSTAFSTGLEQKRLSRADAEQRLVQQLARSLAELEQKQFEVERTQIEVEKARSKADIPSEILPRRDYEENQLAWHKAVVSYEKAQTDLRSQNFAADAESSNLRIEIANADREITTAEEAIESMIVRAPVAGVVVIQQNPNTARKFQIADSVWVGMTMMMITDLDTLGVHAILFDVDDRKISTGQKVELTLDAYPETKLAGTITRITNVANTIGQNSLRRGFDVSIAIDGEKPASIRPGFSVRAVIIQKQLHDLLLAPRSTLDLAGSDTKAHLKNGKTVPVKLGDCNAHDCVVIDGLDEGQELATSSKSTGTQNSRVVQRPATSRAALHRNDRQGNRS